jgi:hypothetical protein
LVETTAAAAALDCPHPILVCYSSLSGGESCVCVCSEGTEVSIGYYDGASKNKKNPSRLSTNPKVLLCLHQQKISAGGGVKGA